MIWSKSVFLSYVLVQKLAIPKEIQCYDRIHTATRLLMPHTFNPFCHDCFYIPFVQFATIFLWGCMYISCICSQLPPLAFSLFNPIGFFVFFSADLTGLPSISCEDSFDDLLISLKATDDTLPSSDDSLVSCLPHSDQVSSNTSHSAVHEADR